MRAIRVAVIGAGISGLTLARHLAGHAEVTVFEKSPGVGGRLATRRIGELQFDHGAQFITARSSAFVKLLEAARQEGTVAEWQPRAVSLSPMRKPWKRDWFEPHFVGLPGMTGLAKYLARQVSLELDTRIVRVECREGQWWLHTAEQAVGPFDWLLSTAPAPQSAALLGDRPAVRAFLEPVRMSPCLAFMYRLDVKRQFPWQLVEPRDSFLSWMADESSKPGRPSGPALMVQAGPSWSTEHFDDDDGALTAAVTSELGRLTGLPDPTFELLSIKRWRHARVDQTAQDPFLLLPEEQLGLCGDYCMGSRVEAAFGSALMLAGRLVPLLGRQQDDRRFQFSNQRGQARGTVRYVEGNLPPGCRFLDK